MTIKELVDEHGFGVKIRGENKGRDAFTVKYEYDGFFCGHYNDGYCAKYPVDDECWELYPEPKPKVMRAQYWYKSNESAIPHISRPYKDDEEFLHYAPETVDWYKRLEEIECES